MIKGRKHVECGKINWEGKDECNCAAFHWPKEFKEKVMAQSGRDPDVFIDVIFDNPAIEKLAEIANKFAKELNRPTAIGYDSEHENEDGEIVGCLTIDYLTIYQEKSVVGSIAGHMTMNGWAIDAGYTVHNYPNEPDNYDYARVAYSQSGVSAICNAFEILVKEDVKRVAEGIMWNTEEPFPYTSLEEK